MELEWQLVIINGLTFIMGMIIMWWIMKVAVDRNMNGILNEKN